MIANRLLLVLFGAIVGACAGVGVLAAWAWWGTEGRYR